MIDRIYTVPLATLQASPIGWNAPDLSVGPHIPSLKGLASLTVDPNNRLILTAAKRTIVLGIRAGTIPGSEQPIPAYAAEPGDTASLTLERSWLSWPTPFEMNFMTGYTHSWRRHLYYRLKWEKASGERLDMLWHFEQGFHRDDGWNQANTDESQTGLIRAEIRPGR